MSVLPYHCVKTYSFHLILIRSWPLQAVFVTHRIIAKCTKHDAKQRKHIMERRRKGQGRDREGRGEGIGKGKGRERQRREREGRGKGEGSHREGRGKGER